MPSTPRLAIWPLAVLIALTGALVPPTYSPTPTAAQALPAASTPTPLPWNLEGIPVAGLRMGNPDAPVDVVVWGDYTCPGCARFALETMPDLIATYVAPGLVSVEFRDFPFRGPNAVRAAEAAACAADQDQFWALHATLFANQTALADDSFDDDVLRGLADAAGLTAREFDRCLTGNRHAGRVTASIAEAECLGIESIPLVLVAGDAADWHDWAALRSTIEQALAAAADGGDPELADDASARAIACSSDHATPIAGTANRGGFTIVLEPRPSPDQALDTSTLIGLRSVLQRRLDALGVEGQVTRRRDDGRIVVHIDASADPVRVADALSTTAQLEIIDTRGDRLAPGTTVATSLRATATANDDSTIYPTIVSGSDLTDVYLTEGGVAGIAAIGFTLDDEASRRLYEFTSGHVGQPMAIVIDNRVVSAPTIAGAIASAGIIEGIPSEDVPVLVALMKAGALAVPLVVVEISPRPEPT
jgi:2-hydroxychromene-2-carboxylate isomerase